MEHKVTFIKNKERKRHLYNQYHAIHSCHDHEIIVIVDGDDWLAHKDVLSYLNSIYANQNVWLTYGHYRNYKAKTLGFPRFISPEKIAQSSFRKTFRNKLFPFSHLRTFYAGLFNKIRKKDLMDEGSFFPAAADLATMFPMVEMAHLHMKFIQKVLLIYNDVNSLSFHCSQSNLQQQCAAAVLEKKSYAPIESYLSDKETATVSSLIKGTLARESITVDFDTAMATNYYYKKKLPDTHKDWKLVKDLYETHLITKPGYSLIPRIPKIIHQIWLGSEFPQKYVWLQETWKKHHPDWHYILWTEKELNAFKLENQKAYDTAANYGEKSDIARYEILYRLGGLYVDTDFECLRSFSVFHHYSDFYTGLCSNADFVHCANGLIGSAPGHPIMRECIERLSKSDKKSGGFMSTLVKTGNFLYSKAFLKQAGKDGNKDIAFPPSFFYPWPDSHRQHNKREQIEKWLKPESFGIHHWYVSWNKGSTS